MDEKRMTGLANISTFFAMGGEFCGGQVSWATSNPQTINLTSGELQLEASF